MGYLGVGPFFVLHVALLFVGGSGLLDECVLANKEARGAVLSMMVFLLRFCEKYTIL